MTLALRISIYIYIYILFKALVNVHHEMDAIFELDDSSMVDSDLCDRDSWLTKLHIRRNKNTIYELVSIIMYCVMHIFVC